MFFPLDLKISVVTYSPKEQSSSHGVNKPNSWHILLKNIQVHMVLRSQIQEGIDGMVLRSQIQKRIDGPT